MWDSLFVDLEICRIRVLMHAKYSYVYIGDIDNITEEQLCTAYQSRFSLGILKHFVVTRGSRIMTLQKMGRMYLVSNGLQPNGIPVLKTSTPTPPLD